MSRAPDRDDLPVGADIAVAGLLATASALLDRRPSTHLLAELQPLLAALAPQAPVSTPRFIDRLLGRDLVRAAHPDPVEARIRLHLQRSAVHAEATEAHIGALDSSLRAIDAWLATAPVATNAATANEARRAEALHATVLTTRAQLALARSTALAILEQYRHLRDLLVPLWRQALAAEAAGAHAEAAQGLAELRSRLAHRLHDLHATASLSSRPESTT